MAGHSHEGRRRLLSAIADLLEDGIAPETIHADLVRRGMQPAAAAELTRRISEARTRAAPGHAPVGQRPGPRPAGMPRLARPTGPALRFELIPRMAPHEPGWFDRLGGWVDDILPRLPAGIHLSRYIGMAAIGCTLAASSGMLYALQRTGERDDAGQIARLEGEIRTLLSDLGRVEKELADRRLQASHLERVRARIARGPVQYASHGAYSTDVARYERSLGQWNATLPRYRALGEGYRALVTLHNLKLDSLTALTHRTGSTTRIQKLGDPPAHDAETPPRISAAKAP